MFLSDDILKQNAHNSSSSGKSSKNRMLQETEHCCIILNLIHAEMLHEFKAKYSDPWASIVFILSYAK